MTLRAPSPPATPTAFGPWCVRLFGPLALAGAAQATPLETITVTAQRDAQALADLAASLSVVQQDELALVSAVHVSEALARVPGVWIARGNGQEHLTAIRSPVLTGAGSCGAFAVTEDNVPVRGTGFCNVNQLFDINTEQAGQIDVLRGPGTVLSGSDAQHGVINVLSLAPAERRETGLGLELGANDYGRLKLSHSERAGQHAWRLSANGAQDGGYKDDAGFGQQKLSLRHDWQGESVDVKNLLSVNNLNQETAGYLVGYEAYKDPARKQENPNPDAFRDARSARLQSQLQLSLADDQTLLLTPFLRSNRMRFLMHYLPGTPVEENGHQSVGLQSAWFVPLAGAGRLTSGLDLEYTAGWLKQSQVLGFGAFPAGKHYDYQVDATVAAAFAALDQPLTGHTDLSAGLRYEALTYRYDNRMRSGDTAEDGSPCGDANNPQVCRYSRPEDRRDSFGNLSANLGLLHKFDAAHSAYLRLTQGERAPQASEMYRLQNGQRQPALDAEQVRSIELGLRGALGRLHYVVAGYRMAKQHVIYQNADRLYLAGGKTRHQGLEYDLQWSLNDRWQLNLAGSFAHHHYHSDISEPGSKPLPTKGNTMVSSPDQMHSLRLGWHGSDRTRLALEWLMMGRYFTDLANQHHYRGHQLLNLHASHAISAQLDLGVQIKNLANTDYAERADYSAFGGDRYFVGEPRALYLAINAHF